MARSTAPIPTVTFNDVSSCRFMESRLIKRLMPARRSRAGRARSRWSAEEGGAIVLRASHDGYVEDYGVLHHRALMLSADGKRLDGEELFTAVHGD